MAESHTGDGAIDGQLTTLPGLGEADEGDVKEIVDALTGHGPEDSAVVMSETQAEALARRKFVGQTRQETAGAMDISVWTVDSNLTRAKDNLETVDEAALAFESTGVFGLKRVDVVGSHTVSRALEVEDSDEESDVDEEAEEAGDQDTDVDDDVAAWGRLMAREAVVEITRPAGSGYVAVEVDDGDVDGVETDLERLGFPARDVSSDAGLSNRTTIRAWEPGEAPGASGEESDESGVESDAEAEADEEPVDGDEDDESVGPCEVLLLGGAPVPSTTDSLGDEVLEELDVVVEEALEVNLEDVENGETLGTVEIDDDGVAFEPADELVYPVVGVDEEAVDDDPHTCHYCGGPFEVNDCASELLVEMHDDPDQRPVCGACLADVAMGDDLDPLPEFVDEDDQGDGVGESDESGAQSDDGGEADESPSEDSPDDETDVYRCECGETFGSGSALGGHSRYCDGVDESDDGGEDVLEDGGDGGDDDPATCTCENCGYTGPRKADAEEGEKAVVWFEDSWMCQECKFKDDRSFGGPPSGSRTPRRGGMGSGGLGRSPR